MAESRLPAVEVFAAGTHRGRTYTRQDLDDMVKNFERFSNPDSPRQLVRVPAVLGHDEEQVALRGSGLPAAAWCRRLYRRGDKLLADFADVPAQVMRLLRGRVYRTVSAEVYDAPPEGVPGSGRMLRRVAFLGGDIPQVKSLEEIPVPEAMAERFAPPPPSVLKFRDVKAMPGGVYAVYSEVVPMDREQLLQLLAKHGMDTAQVTDAVPDPLLMEILRVCDGAKAAAPDEPPPEGQPGQEMGDDATPPEKDDAPPPDAATDKDDEELPEPKDDEERKRFAATAQKMMDRAKRYFEKYCGDQMADDPPPPDDDDDKDEDKPMKLSEQSVAALVAAEVKKAVEGALAGRVQKDIDSLKKFSESQKASAKRSAIDAFCDSRLKEGKLLPVELDAGNPANVRARLYRADAEREVAKFSEGGKDVSLTELDLQMREIDKRPVFAFGERFRSPDRKAGSDDDQVAKVEAHYEQFAESFNRLGVTKERLLAGFQAERKAAPQLTAEEFLGRN